MAAFGFSLISSICSKISKTILRVPYFSLASIINSKISSYTNLHYKKLNYIKSDVFGVDSPDHLDDLLESELLLNIILIVKCRYPHKDPAYVHVHLVIQLIKLLLHTCFSLFDCNTTSLETLGIVKLDEGFQRVLGKGLCEKEVLEIKLVQVVRHYFVDVQLLGLSWVRANLGLLLSLVLLSWSIIIG